MQLVGVATIYGERPRPRAIITGFPDGVAERIARALLTGAAGRFEAPTVEDDDSGGKTAR